jgi:kynurenine formamidase
MRITRFAATALAVASVTAVAVVPATAGARPARKHSHATGLWKVYQQQLSRARYIDLTHTIAPTIPVWKGFGTSAFSPTVDPTTGLAYTYAKDGFEATSYQLATDQLGTQLDPPAHWAPEYPAIDEQVSDIRAFEARHGRIPAGSVVMVRSDWSHKWTEDAGAAKALAADPDFPGVSLAALKFLHLKRHILFHGHEPLDTDTTPTLEGEAWLMHHGYTQAEGVGDLKGVPAVGCLVSMGFPKFKGGLGGYARYVAICPPASTGRGERISSADAPLPASDRPLHWDPALGYRTR